MSDDETPPAPRVVQLPTAGRVPAPEDAPARAAADEEALRVRLEVLRTEHRDLDHAIHALQDSGGDAFTIKRFKAQKLRLKDRIARIEDQLHPDIIA